MWGAVPPAVGSGDTDARPNGVRKTATKFTIHILAAVAEHERDAIFSARTKVALAAAKANGKRLGNYQRIAEAKQRATAARAEAVRPAITATAHLSTRAAADCVAGDPFAAQ